MNLPEEQHPTSAEAVTFDIHNASGEQSGAHSTGEPQSIQYRCVCGAEIQLEADVAHENQKHQCEHCGRRVRPKAIRSDLSITMSISNLSNASGQSSSTAYSESLVGQNLGHFRLESVIGAGGMGTVYRALDTSLQRFVAVKVMHQNTRGSGSDGGSTKGRISSKERLAALLEESVAQARLNHPNVATIYYVGRDGEEPFMAMELLSSGSLAELIEHGPLSYSEAISYLVRIAYALHHASDFDIVHADIKPSNLLLNQNGEVKLSDFGLARIQTANDGNQRISGTPAYFAPELLRGQPMSMQSDMYALGVTFFELLFGKYPFELSGTTLQQKLETHEVAAIEYPSPWPSAIPLEAREVLERLLAKRPEDRFQDYGELINALSAIQPVHSLDAGLLPRFLAFCTDQIPLLAVFSISSAIASAFSDDYGWVGYTVFYGLMLGCALLFCGYLAWIRRGGKSLGRALFQLKVVDEHGLPLAPRRRLLRELARSWFCVSIFGAAILSIFPLVVPIILPSALLIGILGNTVCILMSRGLKAIHDFLCHSRVVLESSSTRNSPFR